MKKIFVTIITLLPILSFAQNCNDFLSVQRSGITYPWKYDIQSKSANFYAGKNSKLNIICNEGKDYKISFQISSSILNDVTIKVTDNSGKVYFSTGIDESLTKDLDAKKQTLASLESQKAKIKINKKKAEIDVDINKLKAEISNAEDDIQNKQYNPKTSFDFTAASTMELVIIATATDNCSGKGCVSVLVANKPTEKSGF